MYDYCIPELFDRQVRLQPGRVAIEMSGRRFTYAELGIFSGSIARLLRSLGVDVGARVGICIRRSPEMIGAALGVLRAGAAYVPLDPQFPDARLAVMVDQADVHLILTEEAFAGRMPQKARVMLVDGTQFAIGKACSRIGELECTAHADDLAYVIFTSGSTGQPKGVMVPHRCVSALLGSSQEKFSFGPDDTWTLYHSFGFDFSVWEMWGCLLSGGRLVIVPEWMTVDFRSLAWLLAEADVSVLNLTPSALWRLCEAMRDEPLPDLSLRWMILGGERLDFSRLGRFPASLERNAPAIVNMYGITETTVHVTFHRVTRQEIGGHASIIGQPLPGMSLYLLDEGLNPVPPGAAGEIYLSGTGVSEGYAGRPDLTAERFLPDPFCGPSSRYMYRTGDLGRVNDDGNYEFVGRCDRQVKIRGFRVEPSELEAALASHPLIRECAVVSHLDRAGDPELVACVVVDGTLSETDLREHIRRQVPGYMLPALILPVSQIPLTPNGKLDRAVIERLLAREKWETAVPRLSRQGQFDDVQTLIADAWRRVLDRSSVGPTDNFFDVGGHSLLVAQLKADLEQLFRREIPVTAFFRYPTVAAMARYLGKKAAPSGT